MAKDLIMCFPISRFRVADRSMLPNFKEGDFVLVSRVYFSLQEGDVIVFKGNEKFLIKRISKIDGENIFAEGDNKNESVELPPITKRELVGKVFWHAKQ